VLARPLHFVLQPWREFRHRFWTLHAYRDHWHGLRLSALMAYYTFYAYRLLWRAQHDAAGGV